MSSAERSANRFAHGFEGSLEGARERACGRRSTSSTGPRRVNHLSTKVEDYLGLVDNHVDSEPRRAYLPTSAPLLWPVDG
jgi:hypothetical protein